MKGGWKNVPFVCFKICNGNVRNDLIILHTNLNHYTWFWLVTPQSINTHRLKGTRTAVSFALGRGGVEIQLHSFFSLGARRCEWLKSRSGRLTPGKETRCPLHGWLLGLQSRAGRVRKIPPPPIRSPDRPASSECLYRLSYPSPHYNCGTVYYQLLLSYMVPYNSHLYEEESLRFFGNVM
jgi:hypothetical protein